jgi:hypothetical protein
MEKTYGVSVLGIVDESLPSGSVGSAYSYQLTSTGDDGDPHFELASGSLPAGLTLSDGGLISGTPTGAETASFRVAVTSGETTCFKDFTLEVASTSICPTTPAGLIWTFENETETGTGTATYSATGDNGSYTMDCPLSGGADSEARVDFVSCIENDTAVAKTMRITFTTTYSATNAPLPDVGFAFAQVNSLTAPIGNIDGCFLITPASGTCSGAGSVAQWDVALPAFTAVTFRFQVEAGHQGTGANVASITGTFVVTVF